MHANLDHDFHAVAGFGEARQTEYVYAYASPCDIRAMKAFRLTSDNSCAVAEEQVQAEVERCFAELQPREQPHTSDVMHEFQMLKSKR